MIVYKLTDDNLRTRGGYQWTVGVPAETSGEGDLCSSGWLHAYRDPLLAVLFAPIHVPKSYVRLWEAEADGDIRDDGTKIGCTQLTLVREIERPVATPAQRVRWAILCAWEVCDDPAWRRWAAAWLDGSDRSAWAARAAWASAAEEAAELAAWAATAAAERAAPLDLLALARRAVAEEAPDAP